MAITVKQLLENIAEATTHGGVKEDVADKQFIQNKKHHGNTQLELEGAPSKIGKRKYVGPIKKVPGMVKEAKAPKAKLERIQHHGFTEIHHMSDGGIHVHHGGNMGDRIQDVQHNVDKVLGKGSFKKLHKNKSKEEGHPNYMYSMFSHKKHLGEDFSLKPKSSADASKRKVEQPYGEYKRGKHMSGDAGEKFLMGMSHKMQNFNDKKKGVSEANLSGKQVYSSMLSPSSDVAKRTGGIKGSAMTKDKKRLMGMSALRVKGAQIKTEDADVNEGSWEDFKKRTFTKQGRVHAAAAEILKSKRTRPTGKKKEGVKEDHSLKPLTSNDRFARAVKTTNRPDTKRWAANKLTAMGKVHYKGGKLQKGPEPKN